MGLGIEIFSSLDSKIPKTYYAHLQLAPALQLISRNIEQKAFPEICRRDPQ